MSIGRKSHFLLLAVGLIAGLPGAGVSGDDYDPTTLVFPSFLHTMGIRKATKMHLMIYTRNKVKVREPEGLAVVRLDSWDDPKTQKDDDEVTGYGVNSGQNVIVYNKSMTSLGFYGRNERGIKRLNRPTAVAASHSGAVYVADTGNHRLVRLRNTGKKLAFVSAIGGLGALAGQFRAPQGIAMDSNDQVYVSDTGNHRIQILRPDDKVHLWFGDQGEEEGNLWHPTGIAVTNGKERWSRYKDAFIAVIDLDGQRVQKFRLDGSFMAAVQMSELGFPAAELQYAALDYYSNIWLTDKINHCIHKFDRDLRYLASFGRKGKGDKEFEEPRGISIYKRFGQVFVAEKESAQYYWIGTDVIELTGAFDQTSNVLQINFFLTEPSYLTLTITGPDGLTETPIAGSKYYSGEQEILLDAQMKHIVRHRLEEEGQAPTPEQFSTGIYRFSIEAEATYSSRKYFTKTVEATVTIN